MEEEKIFRARQDQSTFGPLRGAQLKTYVTNIRKALYAEQQKEKKQKFMEALQKYEYFYLSKIVPSNIVYYFDVINIC